MRPERVLIVIDGMEVGGSQRQVQQLLLGLDRQRWAPELAFFRDESALVDAIRAEGIPVHLVPKRRRIDLPFLRAYAHLLRERAYTLVHAFSLTAELATLLARPLSGSSPVLVASERSFALDRPAWFWWLKRFVVARSAAVVANSRAGAGATARRTRSPELKFAVVANGVDRPDPITDAERQSLRNALGVPDGRILALFVGRLVPVKNLPCLLHALSLLAPDQRPYLALAGDGPLRVELQRMAAGLGVEPWLRLLGERGDVAQLMQAADYLVLPSHFEGLSNALLEAMAAGCPVIASAVGGTPELVENGRNGLLFASGDADALADAMERMAEAGFRARLAVAAREHALHHHSRESLAAAVGAVYERCLAREGCVAPAVMAPTARGPAG